MNNIVTKPRALRDITIVVTFEELAKNIRTGTKRPDILSTARQTLSRVANIWNPAIVYRWLDFERSTTEQDESIVHSGNTTAVLNLGHSKRFVQQARQVLVAVYTAGIKIEEETRRASEKEEFLVAYILDLIGLLVLEKTGDIVKRIAERKAADLEWGVSPFLSPGSIHGWELEEQLKLCSLLPLHEIGLSIREDAVLSPFKSLSCMIGIGKAYGSSTVGTTCQVCSKNQRCELKSDH